MTDFCGLSLSGPVLNGSGTFDAIAAHRTFGDALWEQFPFDAFVTKTITVLPRQALVGQADRVDEPRRRLPQSRRRVALPG